MKRKKVKGKERLKEKLLLFLTFIATIFIIDRVTKLISQCFGGCFIFCIKYSTNYGAAFNLLSGFIWIRIFLTIIALFVLFFTAFFYFKIKKFTYVHTGLIFLFAGTLGNLVDRVFFGYVIDFLTFSFIPFPAFNLADISNLAGVIILIVYLLKKK